MILKKYFFSVFLLLAVVTLSFAKNNYSANSLVKLLRQKNHSQKETSRILILKSYYHNNLDSSLTFAKKALLIAKQSNNDTLKANAWEEIGRIERRLGNNSLSLNASFNALKIYDSLDLNENIATSYKQLANNALNDEDYQAAIKYLIKADHIYTDIDDWNEQMLTKLNLGEAYRLAGKLDSASICFQKILKINKTINNETVKSYALGNLGMVLSAQGNYEVAKEYLVKAIKILQPLGDIYSTSIYTAELGDIYVKEQYWNLGESKFLEAFDMALNSSLKEQIVAFSKKLTDFYKSRKRYDKALNYLEINLIYQDSLVNKAYIQKVEQLKANYEISTREAEIKLLNRINSNQKNILIILIIGVFIVGLLTYILFRKNIAIKKVNKHVFSQNAIIEKLENEKASLLKKVNDSVKNNLLF